MAKYRQLYTEFWSDGFIVDLTAQEKYFYLYLMTNAKTTQCGIYELPKSIISNEIGYDRETVDNLLQKFIKYNKILYSEDTKEIMILNWSKYNIPSSPNAVKCINKEIKTIKNKELLDVLYEKYCELELDVNKLFWGMNDYLNNETLKKGDIKDLPRDYEGAYKELISNEIKNKKQEVKKKKEEIIINKEVVEVINVFESNIHPPTPIEKKKLIFLCDKFNSTLIILAIEEAVIYNAKNIGYIEKVLIAWEFKGIKSSEDVRKNKDNWNKNKDKITENEECNGWNYEGREYDFEELERKLLGWSAM
ncbi:DnaD domain-containing protein [Clostridium cochlearium]|uniref:DnaD and phage-associated domain-containing protein n=1 Tax=Clostridium cochlearium TaxID=1494 RepID=A0ABY0QN29_CLOCO|nr:DnaD domain protein [Clostridium cochlearium]MCG4579826.1 DnaD domain protein [Clostridium cochlearium]SDL33372.1 DnaD and phage-associated domain-containing protein [Clostridium cochlearium]